MFRSATITLLVAALLVACSGPARPSPADFPAATRSTHLEWVQGTVVAQDDTHVIMRAETSGELFDIDLTTVSVFDCRIDCFSKASQGIDKIGDEDALCFYDLYLDGGVQVGKFWIDRYSCPGRTIPP